MDHRPLLPDAHVLPLQESLHLLSQVLGASSSEPGSSPVVAADGSQQGSSDYELLSTNSDQEALEKLQQLPFLPDIVLLDLELNGLQVQSTWVHRGGEGRLPMG